MHMAVLNVHFKLYAYAKLILMFTTLVLLVHTVIYDFSTVKTDTRLKTEKFVRRP